MASSEPQFEALKTAASSVLTCTPTTTVTLRDLLLTNDDSTPTAAASRAVKTTKTSRPKPSTSTAKTDPRKGKTLVGKKEELSAKEKATLATQIVNATLKALSDAAKPAPAPTLSRRPADEGLAKTVARNALRRSNSAPMTPLQPRSLNRVSTSPISTKQRPRSPTSASHSINVLATAECAHMAFATLRTLSGSGKINLPDLQLETGMSSLVGKLINLGLHDHALKELRILKTRLDRLSVPEGKAALKTAPKEKATSQGIGEVLDFGEVKASGPALMLIITSQIHVLRILGAMKKPARTEAALQYLQHDHPPSAINLLLRAATEPKADVVKVARQMEILSQTLLSLSPSVSAKEDSTAEEPRLSVSPEVALKLQTVGLEARMHWWRLAKHQADVDRDIASPFSKCLSAYVRRSKESKKHMFAVCLKAFERINGQLQADGLRASPTSKFPFFTIHQTLVTLARECGNLPKAVALAGKLRELLSPATESVAQCCAIAAQLLSLQLKDAEQYLKDDGLVKEVVSGIQGPLRGDTTELEELLANVCLARKAAMSLLIQDSQGQQPAILQSLTSAKELLDTLILQCPRFCLRWLGKPPEPKSSTKDFLRYEQRKQLLGKSIQHTLDSTFLLIKTRLDQKKISWESMDSILNDCLTLLDYVGEQPLREASASYHAKISHFFYTQYHILKQKITDPKDATALRALRKSIDCVKHRSREEREKAQLTLKLERMAELCKSTGRIEEALASLQTIRSNLVEDGVLEAVAHALQTKSVGMAWALNDKVELLSRTLTGISKLESIWVDWTTSLSEGEQAAALEQRLHSTLLAGGSKSEEVTLEHPTVDALLRVYIPTRFPIRRLRVLLCLLSSTVGNLDLLAEIQSIAKDAVQVDQHGDVGEDAGLANFVPHLKALYSSMTGLVNSYPDFEGMQYALSTWQAVIDACTTKAALETAIDDIPGLLNHLQSVADFLRMKGQDTILSTVLQISAGISSVADGPKPEDLVHHQTSLALQYVSLGHSTKADEVFEKTSDYVSQNSVASSEAVAMLHLGWADYLVTIGKFNKAEAHLSVAKIAFMDDSATQHMTRTRKKAIFAHASHLLALLSLERGDSHQSLVHSRNSVRVMYQDWMKLESQFQENAEADRSRSQDDISVTDSTTEGKHQAIEIKAAGPEFWRLFHPLIRSLTSLSAIYAHLGMYQETMYYAEQAQKVARQTGSEIYMAQCAAWMGSVFSKASNPDKSLAMVEEARGYLPESDSSYLYAQLASQMGSVYRRLKNTEGEELMIARAEAAMETMSFLIQEGAAKTQETQMGQIEAKMAQLEIKEKPTKGARKTTKTQPAKKATTKATKSGETAKAGRAKVVVAKKPTPVVEDAHISSLRAAVIVQRATSLLSQKEWAEALAILGQARDLAKASGVLSAEQVAMASCFIGMSIDQMADDPVFSVIQDSTISFPSTAASSSDRSSPDRLSLTRSTPPKKGRGASAEQREGMYIENLWEAQRYLVDAHAAATLTGDASLLHRISSMLQNVVLLLSASSAKARSTQLSGHATCSVELARNLIWRRERKALALEKSSAKIEVNEWPAALSAPEARRSSLGFSIDMGRFQKDYIDILPASWNVLSVSVSDNRHDLCITKLQAGHSPFVIRLPLERASSRDADSDVFNFEQGRAELLEIIQLTNESCHDARDFSAKGAKTAWWSEREALDVRLKDLLENIEQIWLGGFRGIFSQHQRRADLLARFQKSFTGILDKHLPSRRQVRSRRGKAAAAAPVPKTALDPRILELFIGLGDATAPDCDFDEVLTDLLYFVVDILQFQGERNAYDEIDFDSMVVETFDALHAYHAATQSSSQNVQSAHTILILDKALHVFPWESLPCMQGAAISRVPSLACLRRLILEQKAPRNQSSSPNTDGAAPASQPAGHHVSIAKGTYILNPGGDLKSTQETFSAPLTTHLSASVWTRIAQREPTEAEFETALADSDVLLYFGHGSGAQYIRGRTIRRLDKCRAAAFLMGCSSASLTDAGEFELYGPVWNYMVAGCPAVVGTLWDVTDRDIDRFAGRVFEEWGLVPGGTFREDKNGKGKGKAKEAARVVAETGPQGENTSLLEAVAKARDVCRFRYLNGAAVAVYGIPVYIDK
ncbi:hypothetical protein GQ53DRAFT_61979 [Thozetella sp. PMI_491]|nr:hypothetical protein GQ53DRAFT_61979 [Thozetella sp. PMI_491]